MYNLAMMVIEFVKAIQILELTLSAINVWLRISCFHCSVVSLIMLICFSHYLLSPSQLFTFESSSLIAYGPQSFIKLLKILEFKQRVMGFESVYLIEVNSNNFHWDALNICPSGCLSVYLFVGLVLMLLMVANVYDVPELNFGQYFYMRNDPTDAEQKRLQTPGSGGEQQKYTETFNKSYQKDSSAQPDDQRYLTED